MPYWSSSRVGVQPTPAGNSNNGNKSKKRSERFGRKGITMEDLKKQTALRLAQEQSRQHQGRPSNYHHNGSNSRGAGALDTRTTSPHASSPPPQCYKKDAYLHQYSQQNRGVGLSGQGPEFMAYSPEHTAYSSSQSNGSYSGSTHQSFPYTTADSSSNQQKAKLPHGLTVRELKEMTKARLQAEAANKESPHASLKHQPAAEACHQVPTPDPLVRSRAGSCGMPSPVPPGFAPRAEPTYMRQPQDAENWEAQAQQGYLHPAPTSQAYVETCTASQGFASTRSSQSFADAEYRIAHPFSRSSSFPNKAEYESNRRRAATLSPRLPYAVFEDGEAVESFHTRSRAFTSDHAMSVPRERAFSSDPYPGRERAFTSYEAREQGSYSPFQPARERAFSSDPTPSLLYTQQQHGSAFSIPVGNRARTSSAASMPPISSTADEFGLDRSDASLRGLNSGFVAVREDAPMTPGLADVFRVSSFEEEASVNRLRSATWSEPGSMFPTSVHGDDLADDLASILNLSVAGNTCF